MMTRRILGATLAACAALSIIPGAATADVGLTIYSSADPAGFDPQQFIAQQRQGYNPQYAGQVPGFGVVRDTRDLDFAQGTNTFDFTDVAAFIDPTTVALEDLSVPDAKRERDGVAVLEQNFQFDLFSASKLLHRMLGKTVTVNGVTGKLLASNQGRLVIQTDQGVRIMGYSDSSDVQLGELPQGMLTKPTLTWKLVSPAQGKRKIRTTYQTNGITWRADYNLVLNPSDTAADLGAWVTIMNLSGATYADAALKLIAGDVQRIAPPQFYDMEAARLTSKAMAAQAAPDAFEEKSFFEYHLYTLPRKTTIADNATQQIALFPTVSDVKVNKVLVYYGLPDAARWVFPQPQLDRNLGNDSNKKIDVYIRFKNKEDNHLGIPLPKGKVRVFKQDDADGALEFIGEDLIDHTAKNETVLVKIGQAFDVTGERTITDFKRDTDGKPDWIEETIRITLKNAKDQPQDVIVKENLYRWVNWEIVRHSDDFEKIDARTIHFETAVPAEGEKTIEYTVRYTW